MATGQRIPPHVTNLILQLHREMRRKNGKVTAREVTEAIQVKVRKLYPRAKKGWPGVSVVRRTIAKARKEEKLRGLGPDDRPWSLLAMSFSDISSIALPDVMEAWALSIEMNQPLTIREALWVSRIHKLYERPDTALAQARRLAEMDRAVELTDTYPKSANGCEWLWVEDYFAYSHRIGYEASNESVHEALHRRMMNAYPLIEVNGDDDGNPVWDAVSFYRAKK